MLKDKLLVKGILGDSIVGHYYFMGYDDIISSPIIIDGEKNEIDSEEYYYTEFHSETSESDYHSFYQCYSFKGVHLEFRLNRLSTQRYFGSDFSSALYNDDILINAVKDLLKDNGILGREDDVHITDDGKYLSITLLDRKLDDKVKNIGDLILNKIREYYDALGIHVTRMFGSYILLVKDKGDLRGIYATPIPIKYCPLMIKLLSEVGGAYATKLIESLSDGDTKKQQNAMCELINEVVIKGGYFDTNRPLNSCEANVAFGASETMSSAFKSGLIDAAVIVSNNLGTIITTNEFNTQGAVKRMTGLFHTSPNEKIIDEALRSDIIPVYPHTGIIDQLDGVKKAISMGYKNIAVSVAAFDNYLHKELAELEKKHGVKIYKFGLCTTGIDYNTAINMRDYADVIWSCASKYVLEEIEPNAIAQVGVKIPVYVMTKQGFDIIRNHLILSSDGKLDDGDLTLVDNPVFINSENGIKVLKKKELRKCNDCPHPCI